MFHFRLAFVVIAVAVTASCSNMPKALLDGLSSNPEGSLFAEASQVARLAEGARSDDLDENELREIAGRALPRVKGPVLNTAYMRKALALYYLADFEGLRILSGQVNETGDENTILLVRSLLASSEWFSGRIRSATIRYKEDEHRQMQRKSLWASKENVLYVRAWIHDYINRLAATEPSDAKRMLEAYRSAIGSRFPDALTAQSSRTWELLTERSIAIARGEIEAGYSFALSAYANHHPIVSSGGGNAFSFGSELSQWNLYSGQLYLSLVVSAIDTGRLGEASRYLDEFRAWISDTESNIKMHQYAYLQAAARFAFASGNYRQAVGYKQDAKKYVPSINRRMALLRSLDSVSLAELQMAAGEFIAARSALSDASRLGAFEEKGDLRLRYYVTLACINALSGSEQQDLQVLESLSTGGLRGDFLEARLSGAKTLAFYRKGRADNDAAHWKKAVEYGRQFAGSVRRLESKGLNIRLSDISSDLFIAIAESYLAASMSLVGKHGVNVDDVIDAMTLLQISPTDHAIQSAVSRSSQLRGISDSDLRKYQRLQLEARAAESNLVAHSKAIDADPEQLRRLARNAESLTNRLAQLQTELAAKYPSLRLTFSFRALSTRAIQGQISEKGALIIAHPLDKSVAVVLLSKREALVRSVALSQSELGVLVKGIRETSKFDAQGFTHAFDVSSSARLHSLLFGWASKTLKGKDQLGVVATGSLATIPFSLLVTESGRDAVPKDDYRKVRWLVHSLATYHAPTIHSWFAVESTRRQSNLGSFIAWADPLFEPTLASENANSTSVVPTTRGSLRGAAHSDARAFPLSLVGQLEKLPGTRLEAVEMAKALGTSETRDVVTGSRATRSAVLEMSRSGDLSKRKVVMFSTHGLTPEQVPGLYQPALALAFEGSNPYPSLLTLDDVIQLDLAAEWVILSACNTATADRPGSEVLSGLARGFFFAGARSLLVTHWEVDENSSAAITVGTIKKFVSRSGITRAQALREASLDLIEARNTPMQWSHPAHWAPFSVAGYGGR
jgi:CHAT domain-containing protein